MTKIDIKEEDVEALDDKTLKDIELDNDFKLFLDQSTRVVERSVKLNESYDVTIDYSQNDCAETQDNANIVKLYKTIETKNIDEQAISKISFSPQHNELFLTSYSKNINNDNNCDDGLVNVWNMKMLDSLRSWGIGCLCSHAPHYLRNRHANWLDEFGVVEHNTKTGRFNLYPVTITKITKYLLVFSIV